MVKLLEISIVDVKKGKPEYLAVHDVALDSINLNGSCPEEIVDNLMDLALAPHILDTEAILETQLYSVP